MNFKPRKSVEMSLYDIPCSCGSIRSYSGNKVSKAKMACLIETSLVDGTEIKPYKEPNSHNPLTATRNQIWSA